MIRRPPRSTLFPYTTPLPICLLADLGAAEGAAVAAGLEPLRDNRVAAPLLEPAGLGYRRRRDRKSTRLNSSHANISYAVFCLKKKKQKNPNMTDLVNTQIQKA